MPEAAVQRVLVVGGGITGGVLSLGLAQKGVEVVLVDLRDGLGRRRATASRSRATRSRRSRPSASTTGWPSAASPFSHLRMKSRRRPRDHGDPHAADGRPGPARHDGRPARRHRRHPRRRGRQGRRRRPPRDDRHRASTTTATRSRRRCPTARTETVDLRRRRRRHPLQGARR